MEMFPFLANILAVSPPALAIYFILALAAFIPEIIVEEVKLPAPTIPKTPCLPSNV